MTPLKSEITNLTKTIAQLEQFLPYADGQAYINDKRKIIDLKRKLAYWQDIEKKLESMDKAA